MKHLRAKGILSVVTALLLTAALAVIYGHIGLQTDIEELQKQSIQKMDSLKASVTQLLDSMTMIDYDYKTILTTDTYLSALPFRDIARQEGDAAIRVYENGCIVRVAGDRVIAPQDSTVPQLDAADFRDEGGKLLEQGACPWGKADQKPEAGSSQEADGDDAPRFCLFNRLHENYYYIDFEYSSFTTEAFTRSFQNNQFSYDEIMSDLEKIYNGIILTFQADDGNHRLFYKSTKLGDDVATMWDLGVDVDALEESTTVIHASDGDFVMTLSDPIDSLISEQGINERIALLVPVDILASRRIPRLVTAICISLLFFLTAVILILSSLRVFRQPAITASQRKQYGADRMRRNLIAIGLAGVMTIGLTTFFLNCLMQLYTATQNNMNLLDRINAVASQTQQNADYVKAQQKEICVSYARRIADLLAKYPQLKTPEMLEKMSQAVGADYLMIYDDQGREVMSNAPYVNLSFSRDKQSPSYEFRLLLTGVPSVVHDASVDEMTLLERQMVGVCMDDGNISDGYGALIMAIPPETWSEEAMNLDQLMQTMTPDDSLCMALSPESGAILHASRPALIGQNALNMGMTEHDLKSDILDHFTLDGQRWYSCTSSDGEALYHSAVQANTIYRRLPITALAFSGCFLAAYALLSLMLMLDYTDKRIDRDGPEVVEDEEALEAVLRRSKPDASNRLDLVVDHLRRHHIGQSPEEKTRFAFRLIAGIMLTAALAALRISTASQNRFFILYYVLNGKWTPGINLFAFARIIIITLGTVVAVMGIQLVTGVISALLQKRGETICRLIGSFLQYVAVLALVFSAFDSLGFDTRALLASVGILSLAVSLGAKDLVSDLLSGISIAFSDEYQIGDFIEINDFRGWVQDIGVRTTTLVNNNGNIKHFSNRDVRNILNLSRRNCQYTINVTIASNQSLRQVEEILKEALPKIGKATPEIINGPEYKGVQSFSAGGVIIAISAECKEHNYGKVRSRINREIRLLLEEHGIVIR